MVLFQDAPASAGSAVIGPRSAGRGSAHGLGRARAPGRGSPLHEAGGGTRAPGRPLAVPAHGDPPKGSPEPRAPAPPSTFPNSPRGKLTSVQGGSPPRRRPPCRADAGRPETGGDEPRRRQLTTAASPTADGRRAGRPTPRSGLPHPHRTGAQRRCEPGQGHTATARGIGPEPRRTRPGG